MDSTILAAIIAAAATILAAIITARRTKKRPENPTKPPITLGPPIRSEAPKPFMSDQRLLELATSFQLNAEEGDVIELVDRKDTK